MSTEQQPRAGDTGAALAVRLRDVSRSFRSPTEVLALRGVNLDVATGEYVSLAGPSGAGKSTLLNLIGLLDRPTVGAYSLNGIPTTGLSDRERTRLRGQSIGFVFQSFHLLARRTVLQNVMLGMLYSGLARRDRVKRAVETLDMVGLSDRIGFLPGKLSGGERQRVALARALVAQPSVLLADEPTGSLDRATSAGIMDVFDYLHDAGQTIIVITHDPTVATRAQRQVSIVDGRLSEVPAMTQDGSRSTSLAPRDRYQSRRDRFTWADTLTEALLGLSGRVSRLLLLVAATMLGIGSLVATIGLAQTGSQQITSRLDATTSTQATVKAVDELDPSGNNTMPWDADERVERLNGVAQAGLIAALDIGDTRMSAAPLLDPMEPPAARPAILAATPHLLQTVNGHTSEGTYLNPFHEQRAERVVVLGINAATRLGVTRVDNQPTVFIGTTPYVAIGIIDRAERRQDLLDAVVIPQTTARHDFGLPAPGELQIKIELGAGDILRQQAPIILNPNNPSAFDVIAPPATSDFRQNLLADVDLFFLILGGVGLFIGALSIAVVSTMSVMERRGEIGLRRALGAGRTQIARQIMTENTIVGFLGGLIGAAAGTLTVLTTSIINTWTPVLDLRVDLLALGAGTLVGLLAGLIPATRAAHLEPATALQEGT